MQITSTLAKYHFPFKIAEIFEQMGINEFFPPQAEAIAVGALDRKNLLMAVPTAAGKTFVAELCMLQSIYHGFGKCLYIVPLKALASEKYEDFKKKYSPLGIKVGIATGDTTSPQQYLSGYQILIATAEKVDSLLRNRARWLLENVGTVVLDEIHLINDGARGPTLEILTARIKQLNPKAQLLALSATVANSQELADWLQAELVLSTWRPIPLREGVYCQEKIKFVNFADRLVEEKSSDPLNGLTTDTLAGQGQVLIFVNSRRSAQAASRQLCKSVGPLVSTEEKNILNKLSKHILGSADDSTKICRELAETVKHGVAFHHAGLKPNQKKLIEDHFKSHCIKVICSTPTLAAGVNLPARRAIIRDYKRFESGLGSAHIPTCEYKQCAGRAGRPGYDEYGEAVLMAKTPSEAKMLFDRYINADPEPVISKLGNESALSVHILASIASGYVHDINSTFEFISHTFMAHQKQTMNLIELIGQIFDFLTREKFIEKNGFRFFATPFGQCTSRLYINPYSSMTLRDGLFAIKKGKSFSSIGLLHMISCCPDSPLLQFSKNDLESIATFMNACQDETILNPENCGRLDDFMLSQSIIKTTMLLKRWTEEEREETICDQFNIGPGDIYRHIEAAQWLLNAAVVFADLFEMKNITFPLANLQSRVKYGVKEELIDLTRLRGIGRVRARVLFEHGIKTIADLKTHSADDLAKLAKFDKTLAQEIVGQLSGKTYREQILSTARDMINLIKVNS